MCEELSKKMIYKRFDGILSIGRGGTIVGAILAAKLGTKIYPLSIHQHGNKKILNMYEKLEEGRYLLVDDECYTGQTFEFIKRTLKNLTLETAALVCRGECPYRPDFHVAVEPEERILFPYQY